MPQWRYIKKNASNQVARHLVFFHTAYDERPTGKNVGEREQLFRLGSATFGRYEKGKLTRRREFDFVHPDLFFQRLYESASPRHTTWVFSHSTFNQLTNMEFWDQFETVAINLDAPRRKRNNCSPNRRDNFSHGYCVISDPPFILGIRHTRTQGRVIFIDAINFFRNNLRELGDSCGVKFNDSPSTEDDVMGLRDFCRAGCGILENTFVRLINWIEENECGVMSYTGAQQSMRAFRHRRMTHDILPHDVEDVKRLERNSYYGGQTEAYKTGKVKQHVYQVDVNSLYPYVMMENDYPVKLKRWRIGKKYPLESIRGKLCNCIARVLCSTDGLDFPYRANSGIGYRAGRFESTLAGPELYKLASHQGIEVMFDFAGYEVAPIFRKFVEDFWALRQRYQKEGDALYDSFCKLLLNSLYGKFAQKSPEWEPSPDVFACTAFEQWSNINLVTNERQIYRSIGYNVQKQVGRREKAGSFIAISSFVTSYAREYMRAVREKSGPGNTFYQGVDSLIVNKEGLDNLDRGNMLDDRAIGKLKIQCEADGCVIEGLNDYKIGEKTVRCGVKSSAIMLSDGSFLQDEMSGVPSIFKSVGEKKIIVTPVTKNRRGCKSTA